MTNVGDLGHRNEGQVRNLRVCDDFTLTNAQSKKGVVSGVTLKRGDYLISRSDRRELISQRRIEVLVITVVTFNSDSTGRKNFVFFCFFFLFFSFLARYMRDARSFVSILNIFANYCTL
jgi:hypothetical protein